METAPPYYPQLRTRLEKASVDEPSGPNELSGDFALDVSFVDDAEIHVLNRDYRGKDRPTDVLSFPQWEGETFDFGEGPIALGDLVISIETAWRQARELGHPLESELDFLTIHGTLHLLGYDHVTAVERRRMWRWQEALFGATSTAREVT